MVGFALGRILPQTGLRVQGYIGIVGYILGLYRDNGKENRNYYLGLGFRATAK